MRNNVESPSGDNIVIEIKSAAGRSIEDEVGLLRGGLKKLLDDRFSLHAEGPMASLQISPDSIRFRELTHLTEEISAAIEALGILQVGPKTVYKVSQEENTLDELDQILAEIRELPGIRKAIWDGEYVIVEFKDEQTKRANIKNVRAILEYFEELKLKSDPELLDVIVGQVLRESLTSQDKILERLALIFEEAFYDLQNAKKIRQEDVQIAKAIITAAERWAQLGKTSEESWKEFDEAILLLNQEKFQEIRNESVRERILQINGLEAAIKVLVLRTIHTSPQDDSLLATGALEIAQNVRDRFIRITGVSNAQHPQLQSLISLGISRFRIEHSKRELYQEYSSFIRSIGGNTLSSKSAQISEILQRYVEIRHKRINLDSHVEHSKTHGEFRVVAISPSCYLTLEKIGEIPESLPSETKDRLQKERTIKDVDPRSVTVIIPRGESDEIGQ